jgi:hypothetical protein
MTRLYDPLTYRHPRSLDETEDTRFKWWISGHAATQQQEQLRMQLQAREPSSHVGAVVAFCLTLISALAAALWMIGGAR